MRRLRFAALAAFAAYSSALPAQPVGTGASSTLARDAGQFAACLVDNDADCVFTLTDVEALVAAGVRTPYADQEALRSLWTDAPRADAALDEAALASVDELGIERMTRFELTGPGEPFAAGDRLYAFVPFFQTNSMSSGRIERSAFLVAMSEDAGDSWRFNIFNGYHLLSRHVANLYPDLSEIEPPETRNEFIPRPEREISRYLRTTDALFEIGPGAAIYSLSFETRRKLRTSTDVIASFDNPAEPDRPVTVRFVLSPDERSFAVQSPPMTGLVRGKEYTVSLHGFAPETGEAIFEHSQRLLFDPTREMWALLQSAGLGSDRE